MKILLIATNRHGRYMNNIQAQPLPLGLAYIAGYLDPDRHTTTVSYTHLTLPTSELV